MKHTNMSELDQKYVLFCIADEQYGINISNVREIVRWAKVTRVPQTSDQICGIRNLRGEVVPIMSLRIQLGLPERANLQDSKIIIIELKDSLFGAVVDSVDEVLEIEASAVQEPPASIVGELTSFVYGVVQSKDGLILLIDVEEMVTEAQKVELDEVIAE